MSQENIEIKWENKQECLRPTYELNSDEIIAEKHIAVTISKRRRIKMGGFDVECCRCGEKGNYLTNPV